MPAVAVGPEAGVERSEPTPAVALLVGDKADVHGIEQVVSPVEEFGAIAGRLEEVREGGHGAVVEERAADPDAVQRDRDVAPARSIGRAEVVELPGVVLG